MTIKEAYACPYCGASYAKEYEASDCASNCVEVDDPVHITVAYCEMCNEKFGDCDDAKKCELRHELMEDLHYNKWLVKKNFERLADAASHPAQMKLVASGKLGMPKAAVRNK